MGEGQVDMGKGEHLETGSLACSVTLNPRMCPLSLKAAGPEFRGTAPFPKLRKHQANRDYSPAALPVCLTFSFLTPEGSNQLCASLSRSPDSLTS